MLKWKEFLSEWLGPSATLVVLGAYLQQIILVWFGIAFFLLFPVARVVDYVRSG